MDGEDEDDGNETEKGVETETDADDYQDMRASIGVATPGSFDDANEGVDTRDLVTSLSYVASASQDDFQFIMTVTNNNYSSDSDDSLRATRKSGHQSAPVSPWDGVATPVEPLTERPGEAAPRPVYAGSAVGVMTPKPVYTSISITTEVPESPKPTYASAAVETDIPLEPEVVSVSPEPEPVVQPVYIPSPPKPVTHPFVKGFVLPRNTMSHSMKYA